MEAKSMLRDHGDFTDNTSPKQVEVNTSDVTASIDKHSTDILERAVHLVRQWATFALLLGFFTAAFVLAVGHFLFFRLLDGTPAEHRRIEQSQITALSLLITTAFKACIISAVGISFAQYLWRLVRRKPLRISRIEQLFRIRSNPLELARVKALLEAPLLFIMALSVWLIPIAAIYPPSALTVIARPYSSVHNVSTSLLNPRAPPDWEPLYPDKIIYPSLSIINSVDMRYGGSQYDWVKYNGSLYSVCYEYTAPVRSLLAQAKLSLLSGEIAEFPSPDGQNSSYSLDFRGPQVSCETTAQNITVPGRLEDPWILFNTTWFGAQLIVQHTEFFGWYPFNYEKNKTNSTLTFVGEVKTLECYMHSVQYNLNISYLNGARQIEYSKQDVKPLRYPQVPVYTFYWDPKKVPRAIDVPVDTPEFKNWEDEVKEEVYKYNSYALLDASMQAMEYNWTHIAVPTNIDVNFTSGNGTRVKGNEWHSRIHGNPASILQTSVFNPQRFNNSINDTYFDPRKDLVITESAINEYITNVTISALSLNTWKSIMPINTTEYRSTYHFSKPLNLILPYALSLVCAFVFVAIGTWSMVQNGTPAVDGGFLQVMTTTTGRTEMERLVGEGMLKELMNMKVRYGELVDAEGVGTGVAGFGRLEETKPLRRGWSAG